MMLRCGINAAAQQFHDLSVPDGSGGMPGVAGVRRRRERGAGVLNVSGVFCGFAFAASLKVGEAAVFAAAVRADPFGDVVTVDVLVAPLREDGFVAAVLPADLASGSGWADSTGLEAGATIAFAGVGSTATVGLGSGAVAGVAGVSFATTGSGAVGAGTDALAAGTGSACCGATGAALGAGAASLDLAALR
jgi:hypothetical protein